MHRVFCQFCKQTYVASGGERCDLCGKTGGLQAAAAVDPPTVPADASWAAPGAVPGTGVSMLTGCLFIMLGCVAGVIIANLVPLEAADPANPPCGLFELVLMTQRTLVGGILGTICGGLVGAVVLVFIGRMRSRNRV